MILRHTGPLRHALSRATRLPCPSRRHTQADSRYRVIGRPSYHGVPEDAEPLPNALDDEVLKAIRSRDLQRVAPLSDLFSRYDASACSVLDATLVYEPSPPPGRRVSFDGSDHSGEDVLLLAHAVDVGSAHKVAACSGFAIQADLNPSMNVIISCAHTLEEIRHSRLMDLKLSGRSGTLAFGRSNRGSEECVVTTAPAVDVLASLPRSDLAVFATSRPLFRTLPVSPYAVRAGTAIRAHFVSETRPVDATGWSPWVYGTWRKWVRGEVLGYRDFAGREAEPGTYDALNHLLFSPPPSAGSSGGPIVDEETGSVIGIILGSRMDNRIEGVRGWGVPSEAIYEMFRLPGLSHQM